MLKNVARLFLMETEFFICSRSIATVSMARKISKLYVEGVYFHMTAKLCELPIKHCSPSTMRTPFTKLQSGQSKASFRLLQCTGHLDTFSRV